MLLNNVEMHSVEWFLMSVWIISMLWGIIWLELSVIPIKINGGRETNMWRRGERCVLHIALNFLSFVCWQVFHKRKCWVMHFAVEFFAKLHQTNESALLYPLSNLRWLQGSFAFRKTGSLGIPSSRFNVFQFIKQSGWSKWHQYLPMWFSSAFIWLGRGSARTPN